MSGYAGTLPGSLTTDNSGGVSYRVDIDVPPGIAGVAPDLSFCYSSLAGNGPLGFGWDLGGLSVIERSASTLAQDGFLGGVTFGDGDRLTLDGSRLVLQSGSSYFDPASIYETEIQSWHKVVPLYLGTPGRHGPDAFEVHQRDGRVFRYGITPDSQGVIAASNPSIRAWYLSSITDRRGNMIVFGYIDAGAGGQRLPSLIAYTANGATAARRSVRFAYESRTDVEGRYVAGYEMRTDIRLASVTTYVDDAAVSSYALAYEYGSATGRSRLVAITRADGSGVPLPATTFAWQEATVDFGAPAELDTSTIQWGGSFLPMDIDGDGRVDFVNAYQGSAGELCLAIYMANADGSFAPPIAVPSPGLRYGGQIVTLDANGDGRMELLYAAADDDTLGLTLFTATSQEGGWTLTPGPINGAGPSGVGLGGTLVAADVDGDGLADIVYMSRSASGELLLRTFFSDGVSFAASPTDKTAPTTLFGGTLMALDANADGMDDLVYAVPAGGGTDWTFTLYTSTGRNGFVETSGVLDGVLPAGGQLIPLDVNADGNTDIIHVGADPAKQTLIARVLVNDGLGFTVGSPFDTGLPFGGLVLPASISASSSPELLVLTHDENGALMVSAFRTAASGLTAIDSIRPLPAGTKAGGTAMPLDLRGIGFSDLVYAVNSGGIQQGVVMPALGPYPDLMLSAINGVGGGFSARYASLTDPSVYAPTDPMPGAMEPRALLHTAVTGGSYAVGSVPLPSSLAARQVLQRTPIPKYVVASSAKSDGIGGTWTMNYRYRNALIDLSGRGWLGFGTVETDDVDIGTTTSNQLHQLFPLTQMLVSSTVTRTSDGTLMTEADFTYQTPQVGASCQILNVASSTLSYSFAKPGSTADTTLTTTSDYDGHGNVVRVVTDGSALAAGSIVEHDYQVDESQWQLGLLVGRTEYADTAQTQLLRCDRFSYDPVTWQVLGHGRQDDVSGAWLQTAYGYDGFGNLLSSTDPAGAVKTTAYETDFHTFAMSETVAPSATTILIRRFVHEPAFGCATTTTDPAGATRSVTLDGLGRIATEARTAPDGTSVEVTRWAWDMTAGMLYQQTCRRLDWTADDWTTERVFADGLGRTVRTQRDPANGGSQIVTETRYTSNGAKLTQTLPHFDGTAGIAATWTYDAFGRVTSATTPAADGTPVVTTTTYPRVDTAQTTIASGTPYAQVTTIRYGVTGGGHVPVWRQDNAGGISTYAYDGLGHLLSLTDPTGIRTSATFDTLGRQVTTAITAAGKTTGKTIQYQDMARTAIETTTTGSISLVRDGLNRVIEKTVGSGATTHLIYDEADMPFAAGRLTTVELPSGDMLRYGYDPDGNVAVRHVTLDGMTSIIANGFLPDRRRASTTFPDGSVQINGYGPSGKLASIDFAEPKGIADRIADYAGLDAFDNPATVTFGNGVGTSLGYDAYGRLASQHVVDRSGIALFDDRIERAPTDAVITVGDPSSPRHFGYDAVGRLQSADEGGTVSSSYAYDASGNCISASGTAITYTGYSPVSGVGADPFTATYDNDGGVIALERDGTATTYRYDDEQQLLSVGTESGSTATFSYDHGGQRLTKTENGIVTWYVGPEYEIVRFPDGSRQHSCIVGERGVREFIATMTDQGDPPPSHGIPTAGTAFFVCDHLKSVRVVLDGAGAVGARLDYDPFGAAIELGGNATFRYSFSGREFDAVASAYYFGARYYDPRLRRFLTPDDQLGGALIERDTFNVYAYVLNNPAALIDRNGHSWWDFAGQIALDVVMVAAGVALVAVTGGAANIAGSTLIGAGIGGLAYDIKAAATGKGAHVDWGKWGIGVGIGAATGLLTGGVAVGAGSALTTAGVQSVARAFAMAGIMAVTSSASSMASTVVNNAVAGSSLTSGLGMAGVSGAVVGLLGGGFSAAISEVFSAGAGAAGAGVEPEAVEMESLAAAPEDTVPQNAVEEAPAAQNRAPSRSYSQGLKSDLTWKTDAAGKWQGFAWAPVRNSSPRFIFGSLRSVLMGSMPDFAKLF